MHQETLHYAEAVTHLQQADPVLGYIIARCGPCTLQPQSLEPLVMLCRSIIYQQLSGKAAGTIMMRFLGLYDLDTLTLRRCSVPRMTLRGIGLSRPKIVYLKDLAIKVQDGALNSLCFLCTAMPK